LLILRFNQSALSGWHLVVLAGAQLHAPKMNLKFERVKVLVKVSE